MKVPIYRSRTATIRTQGDAAKNRFLLDAPSNSETFCTQYFDYGGESGDGEDFLRVLRFLPSLQLLHIPH
jgi:hypothetical protein